MNAVRKISHVFPLLFFADVNLKSPNVTWLRYSNVTVSHSQISHPISVFLFRKQALPTSDSRWIVSAATNQNRADILLCCSLSIVPINWEALRGTKMPYNGPQPGRCPWWPSIKRYKMSRHILNFVDNQIFERLCNFFRWIFDSLYAMTLTWGVPITRFSPKLPEIMLHLWYMVNLLWLMFRYKINRHIQ